jgi:TonB family protein
MRAALLSLYLSTATPILAVSTPIVEGDEEVWALAQKVDTVAAYETYLRRFPAGAHHDAAVAAYYRSKGMPVVYAPPPPPNRPSTTSISPPAGADPCITLQVQQTLNQIDSKEGRAFLAAGRSNRPSDYQAYLDNFPRGICRAHALNRIRMREAVRLQFGPIPGFGPLKARRLIEQVFTDGDYPPAALRYDESGRVVAAWDVAEDGFVESCHIVQSSGAAALDEATCRVITLRMRYDPARDSSGVARRSVDNQAVTWNLPSKKRSARSRAGNTP